MGNNQSYYVYDNLKYKDINTHNFPMVLVVGLEQVYNFNNSDFLVGKLDGVILSKEPITNTEVSKKYVSIYRFLRGENLKHTLKKYGSVIKVNNYYMFTPVCNKKIYLYNSISNVKTYDQNHNRSFVFDILTSYDLYIV